MTSQFQIINKILQTKDYSLVSMNNLTEDHFFQYRAEFNFIKNHYEKFRVVPDRLTFLNTFPDFDITDVTEPDAYLLEQQFGYSRDEAMAETAVIMRRDTVGVVPRYQSSNNRV